MSKKTIYRAYYAVANMANGDEAPSLIKSGAPLSYAGKGYGRSRSALRAAQRACRMAVKGHQHAERQFGRKLPLIIHSGCIEVKTRQYAVINNCKITYCS